MTQYDPKCREAGYVLQDGVLVCVNCRRAADEIFADDSEAETSVELESCPGCDDTGEIKVYCNGVFEKVIPCGLCSAANRGGVE